VIPEIGVLEVATKKSDIGLADELNPGKFDVVPDSINIVLRRFWW
jgi:hypothetical protein